MTSLAQLTDQQLLLDNLRGLEGTQRRAMASLLEHFGELDERRLHLGLGYSSLFEYCVRALGLSEDEAYRRMTVARLGRRWPAISAGIAAGEVSLSGWHGQHYLNDENVAELLALARNSSKRAIEAKLAARFPAADVGDSLRRQPVSARDRGKVTPLSAARFHLQLTVSSETKQKLEQALDLMSHINPGRALEPALERALELLLTALEREKRGRLKDELRENAARLKAERGENAARLKGQAGARHQDSKALQRSKKPPSKWVQTEMPGANLHDEVGRGTSRAEVTPTRRVRSAARGEATAAASAATVAEAPMGGAPVAEAPMRNTSVADVPAAPAQERRSNRSVARAIRRAVFERDGARCGFVGRDGHVCGATAFLEIDHQEPWALGGASATANLRVLCRTHNQLVAEEFFGRYWRRSG